METQRMLAVVLVLLAALVLILAGSRGHAQPVDDSGWAAHTDHWLVGLGERPWTILPPSRRHVVRGTIQFNDFGDIKTQPLGASINPSTSVVRLTTVSYVDRTESAGEGAVLELAPNSITIAVPAVEGIRIIGYEIEDMR